MPGPRPRLPHLEERRTGFYWRRRIPTRLRSSFGKSFLVVSLRTHILPDAKESARRLDSLTDLAFDLTRRTGRTMAPELMDRFLTALVRFELEAFEQARAVAPRRSPEDAAFALDREAALQDTLRQAILLRDREVARAPLRHVARRLGLPLPEDDTDWQALAMTAVRVLLDLSEERMRREQGIYDTPCRFFRSATAGMDKLPGARGPVAPATPEIRPHATTAPVAPLSPVQDAGDAPVTTAPGPACDGRPVGPPAAPAAPEPCPTAAPSLLPTATAAPVIPATMTPAPAPAIPPAPVAPAAAAPARRRLRLSEAFDLYAEARAAGKKASAAEETADPVLAESYVRNSLPNVRATKKLLVDATGDPWLDELGKRSFTEAFGLLQRLPKSHGKGELARLGVAELAAETDRREAVETERLEADMRRRGCSAGNIEAALWAARRPRLTAATTYRHMQDTQRVLRYMVVLGHLAENHMTGVIWTKKQLKERAILEEDNNRVPWTPLLPQFFRTPIFQEELEDPGDPLFWAPLISLHGGLREEEALQLRTVDVVEEHGIAYLDIKVGPNQSLKSAAARRRVPIHGNLIALGFLDLARLRRRQGEVRLFPHQTRGRTRKTLSENFTKRFTRYRTDNGVYDRRRDYHAFRTTFNVEMIRNRVDSEVRKVLMGHEITDVNFTHYGGDGYTLEHLRDVVDAIEIDISMIRKPFAGTQSADVRHLHVVAG
ncbi:Phage integrase family protein [Rhodovulum sp. ES.010]|uniref:site-specific integrase n=1 Tax=Rhodovulum sp. ES.010 TaxID=1882821 RepID=UPI00092895C5|nr:site-specific integrase [Rhodovulum sp. ES.010]SIO10211.1 Phage integrase family protein [Rhodovulum sp. ES.010]